MSNRRRLNGHRRGVRKAEKRRAQGKTPVYDDGRRYNGYQCSPNGGCGGIYLTVDLDKGVTPMFMPCLSTPDCDGLAASMGYPRTPPPKKVPLLVEWYEPLESEMKRMSPAMAEYVRKGSLLRRPTEDAPEWVKEKLGPVYLRRVETRPTQLELIEGGDNAQHTGQEPSGSPD